MKKKNITKVKTDKDVHGIGVLLEHMDSKIDLLAEGQHGLQAQVDRLDQKIEGVDSKVDNLSNEMNYKFDIVFDELHIIKNDLKEKVGRDEFNVLEKRLSQLEKKVSHIEK